VTHRSLASTVRIAKEPTDFRGALNIAGRAAEQPPPQQLVHSKVEAIAESYTLFVHRNSGCATVATAI